MFLSHENPHPGVKTHIHTHRIKLHKKVKLRPLVSTSLLACRSLLNLFGIETTKLCVCVRVRVRVQVRMCMRVPEYSCYNFKCIVKLYMEPWALELWRGTDSVCIFELW